MVRFKRKWTIEIHLLLLTFYPYFSKEVKEQKTWGYGSTSVTQKRKQKLLTVVENLCNFLYLLKYVFFERFLAAHFGL